MLNSNNNVIDSLPAFSIVIPTRNGVRYLPFAIGSALNQDFHEFEIIISDNHSTDGTSDYLSGLTDDRCKIFRPESPLPMVKHFEFAISKAKGEWLVILGDDDGIQPYFFDLANKLINLDPSIEVISSARAYYIWPGCEPQYGDLVTSYNASRGLEVRKSIWCLKKLLFSDDDYFGAPLFYTGTIIKRSLVERILKNNSGQLFRTSIMDANSVSLVCRYVKSYIYSNIPLGWVGASPKSTGFAHVQSIAAQDKESEARVKDFDDLNSGAGLEVDRRFELIKFVNNFDLYFLEGFFAVFAKPGSIMAAVLWSFPVRHLLFLKILKRYKADYWNQSIRDNYEAFFLESKINLSVLFRLSSVKDRIMVLIESIYPLRGGKGSPVGENCVGFFSHLRSEYPSMDEASERAKEVYDKIK